MKKSINLSDKNFQFFLAGSTQVESLEAGAIQFGGATLFNGVVKSNIQAGDFVEVTDKNTIRVFVPSTIAVDVKVPNYDSNFIRQQIEYVAKVYHRLFKGTNLQVTESKGSWYSDSLKKVVVEDIYIVSIDVEDISESDIHYLQIIANSIKNEMSQEGVSIMINEALAIV